jgi:2-oxoglutarate dehydrogenase E1 component
MTPKSLLRLPAARSRAEDFTDGSFAEVVGDPAPPEHPQRLILTQGKMAFDLLKARHERGADVAVARIEQLYPFPAEALARELAAYQGASPVWVQEEPLNMGAWRYLHVCFNEILDVEVAVVAREESASPATGSLQVHQREQATLVEQALGLGKT